MEIPDAIKIIRSLADGIHPFASSELPQDSPCRDAQCIIALNRAVGALTAQHEYEKNRPTSAGKYWSKQEEAIICEELRNGITLEEIARKHDRTVVSIAARLLKLGKIAAPAKPANKPSATTTPTKVA